jgi:hypothetical protein
MDSSNVRDARVYLNAMPSATLAVAINGPPTSKFNVVDHCFPGRLFT